MLTCAYTSACTPLSTATACRDTSGFYHVLFPSQGEVSLTGAGGAGGSLFENEPSDLVRDPYTSNEMYNLCEDLLGIRADARAKNAEPALP